MDAKELDQLSITDVVQRTGLELKKAGSATSQGLCPLHVDVDTPSFTVYETTNSWCCYGISCGDGIGRNTGGPIEFIKQRYNYSFKEATQWLEDNFGHFSKSKLLPIELPQMHVPKKIVAPDIITYWHNNLGNMRVYFKNRGFEDAIINKEMWGWDGHRLCIPVWEAEPGKSDCIGVRKRITGDSKEPKYIGFKGVNEPTVWGRYYCRDSDILIAFAGELDAARAVQDDMSAFSVVNGVNSIGSFPETWPDLWFPNSSKLIIVFDRKEEIMAARMAQMWNKYKNGFLSARVFHWLGGEKDYCEFRDRFELKVFKQNILSQLGVVL